MDPLKDEKFILATSSSFIELAHDWLNINVMREAYGSTINEGLCYEYCSEIQFTGSMSGSIFLSMDGYTKLLILPYIAKNFSIETHHPELTESALLSFHNQLMGLILQEVQEFIPDIESNTPELKSHKLISINQATKRKYMMIFFLKDEIKKKYLGRIYLFVAINK